MPENDNAGTGCFVIIAMLTAVVFMFTSIIIRGWADHFDKRIDAVEKQIQCR